jgi:hypothetical protein
MPVARVIASKEDVDVHDVLHGGAHRLEFWGYPESRAFAELLIDCEEDRTLGARGMLRGASAGACGRGSQRLESTLVCREVWSAGPVHRRR